MPVKKSTCAAQQLLDAIRLGEFPVASRLPPERVLASQMNTSRGSIRESLAILQGFGIVETRPSDGSYVCKPVEDENIIGQARLFIEETSDLIQIWDARKYIEPALVVLSIERGDSCTLQDARDIVNLMREAAEKGEVAGYLSADREFHVCIASMSRNTPLVNAVRALSQVTTNHLLEKVNREYVLSSLGRSLKKHEAIFDAVAEKDKDAAIEAIRFHFRDLERYFRKTMKNLPLEEKREVTSLVSGQIESRLKEELVTE